jgi:HEAT repeat protein
MAHWFSTFILAVAPLLLPIHTVEDGIRRVQAHLLIDDASSALADATRLAEQFPDSLEAGSILIEAFAAAGFESQALDEWHRLSLRAPGLLGERHLLEEIAWGILKKELRSTQYSIRLAALIGSYLTRDVRALPILLKMMRDSNAMIRSVAVQMSTGYGDAPLKDEIERMMAQEKVWIVQMEVIQAAGKLRLKSALPKLHTLVQSEKAMIEERQAAIEALIHISERMEPEEVARLSRSNRAGLRHFSCAIATHFEMKEVKEEILKLLNDTHPDVRVAALNALGLFYRNTMTQDEIKAILKPRLEENEPRVSITAAWVAQLIDPSMGTPIFEKWLQNNLAENRRLAAAALAASGDRGVLLSTSILKNSADPFVRANVALGLIGQRQEVSLAADCIYDFLMSEKKMWMWDNRSNPLFQVLAPSHVRHIDQIPNYPEAIDQMTRLNLVSLLAMVEDPRATAAMKNFLHLRKWQITGVAAAMLLQEGDETSLTLVRELLEDSDPQIRLQACLVLAMYGKDETVLKDLQGAYSSADFEMKLHILEALGAIGSSESFSFLVGVLREPFPLLRVAGAAALIQGIHR